nr:hypothetical protein [Pseudomonas sp. P13]
MKLTDPAELLPSFLVEGEQDQRVQINPSGISQNTDTHIIGITEDKLHRILGEYQRGVVKSQDWIAPLGIFISLGTTLFTTTFRDFLIGAEYWRLIFICGASVSFYLTMSFVVSRRRNQPMTLKQLVDTIAGRTPFKDT